MARPRPRCLTIPNPARDPPYQVLRKAGSLVEAEVDFLIHGYVAGHSSLPPIPTQVRVRVRVRVRVGVNPNPNSN